LVESEISSALQIGICNLEVEILLLLIVVVAAVVAAVVVPVAAVVVVVIVAAVVVKFIFPCTILLCNQTLRFV
jgi:hypothetical protein